MKHGVDHSAHTRHSAVSKRSTQGEAKRSQMGLDNETSRRQCRRQRPS